MEKWDGPYFDDDYKKYDTYDAFFNEEAKFFLKDNKRCILYNNEPVGMVSMYWENEKTRWLNIGITIFSDAHWGKGIGRQALELWISHIFKTVDNLEHIGLVTWSGNERMMKVAEKIGMIKEAQIRKVRFHNNHFYDSVSYGILKEEWANLYTR
ncbi:MAG TPA: GNAT family protein [Erysipelothrix sp.]